MWLIKSSGGNNIENFIENKEVFVGFSLNERADNFDSKEQIKEKGKFIGSPSYFAHSQLFRFAKEIDKNDYVLTYNPKKREYYFGILSDYNFKTDDLEPKHLRKVDWLNIENPIKKDIFSKNSQYGLGSLQTITLIRSDVKEEIFNIIESGKGIDNVSLDMEGIIDDFIPDFENSSKEDIKTHILSISPENMEIFIAGVFRAMGCKTRLQGSFTQADGGYDIVASKDGLGLGDNTIYIEVKHRKNQMTSSDISQLKGALNGKKGVYFSSGGFSKDARNRNSITRDISLIDLDYLVDLIFEYYESFDSETKKYLPLRKIYILENKI